MEDAKILVVDDKEANIYAMNELLASIKDLQVISARSGAEALSLILRHDFALVLLDVQMPDMDGIETAALIRDGDSNSQTPIIFVTAINKEQNYIFKGYDAGAVDYLLKPIDADILRSKVKVFIEMYKNRQLLKQKNAALEKALSRNQLLLESAGEGILGVNTDGIVQMANPVAKQLLCLKDKEVEGLHISEFIPSLNGKKGWKKSAFYHSWERGAPIHVENSEFSHLTDSDSFPVDYTYAPIQDEDRNGGVLIFRDITLRKKAEEQLVKMAKFDQLTELANRNLFRDFLVKAMARAVRQKESVGVLFIDLDFFKEVNDKFGHNCGDLLLVSVASRLRSCVRVNDLVARLGGDEFAVILDMISSSNDAAMVAEKIIGSLSQVHEIDGRDIFVSPSIGIAIYPGESDTPEEVIKCADSAMYRAKESGRNNYQFYDRKMYELAREKAHLENELRAAAHRKDFLIYYQPQIDVKNGKVIGLEALLRWPHSDFGMVSPQLFIPAAENIGLITDIGSWVLKEVFSQGKQWFKGGFASIDLTVALNVSAKQLQDGSFDKMVMQVLDEVKVDPSKIEIELTESTLMDDPQMAIDVLKRVHDLGIRIAVDDFGTGFSALSYLNQLPIDTVKIDRQFVKDIGADEKDEAIVRAIIGLAHTLGMKVIAEGVETKEQVEFLQNNGCDVFQGYYFSRPVSVDVASQMLSQGIDLKDFVPGIKK
ncbi:MAG: EAL domain-containing protein [Gammaproteobacteria bacterium]|nr:MAG: EAL domain-containing protein [Gammaproteobacteria bacterium]